MPQLHTYIPARLAAQVAARAKARGVPVSRYLAELIRRDVDRGWPEAFFDRAVGGWQGRRLRRAPQGGLEEREAL